MNKQNRKIKKGILLATVAAVIGIGFWVGKTAEPLKAETKTEQKISDSKSEATKERTLKTDETKAPESDDETTDVAPTIEEETADTKSSESEAFDAMVTNGDFALETPFILVSEIKGKNKEQILTILQNVLQPSYTKNTAIGAKIIDTTVNSESRGSGTNVTVQRADGVGDSKNIKVFVTPDAIWDGADDRYGWTNLPAGSNEGYLENPINHSKAGFPGRGGGYLNTKYVDTGFHTRAKGVAEKYLALSPWSSYASSASGTGFVIQDSGGYGYIGAGLLASDLVAKKQDGKDGSILYGGSGSWYQNRSLATLGSKGGNPPPNSSITYSLDYGNAYFLKKGDAQGRLKQIFMDTANRIIYVYNISLKTNLNFYVELQTYNVAPEVKNYGMLEMAETAYLSDASPVYPLPNNQGFYMVGYDQKDTERKNPLRLALKLKNNQGEWLSDYSMYQVGTYHQTMEGYLHQKDNTYPWSGIGTAFNSTASQENMFGANFTIPRQEIEPYKVDANGDPVPYVTAKQGADGSGTGYELGAPYKTLKQDEALKTGYEVFVGDELPYMQIMADPHRWDIYPDQAPADGFTTNYTLSKIPEDNAFGDVTITFPDGKTEVQHFTGGKNTNWNSQVTIPRNTLPTNLVGDPATKQSYFTSFLAVNKTPSTLYGLPSDEYAVPVNVYNLGFTPVINTIKQNTTWDKTGLTIDSLVKNDANDPDTQPVIIPGHTPKYEFVDGTPQSQTWPVGVSYVPVKMTDTNSPTHSVVINVPIIVTPDGKPSDKDWIPVLTSNILKEYKVNDAQPSEATVKGWFENQINFLNVKTGKYFYTGSTRLPSDAYSVTRGTWNNKNVGIVPYPATITIDNAKLPTGVKDNLIVTQFTTSDDQLQINFTSGQPQVGGDITVTYYVDGKAVPPAKTVDGGPIGSYATIPAMDNASNYDFDKAILPNDETVTTWSALTNKVKFTAEAQTVKVYYKTKPVTTGGAIKVDYYVDNNYMSTETVSGGTIGSIATIPNPTTYKDYDFQKALLTSADGQTIKETFNTWPTTVKFTTEEQAVYIYYVTKPSTDVTVKVTMVDEAGNPISFPAGTTKPLTLYDSNTVFATDSSVSGSTVSFASKIKKGDFYRIGQNTAIVGYLKYDQDPKAGENQTPKIGVSTDNKAEFSGNEKPPTEKDGWLVYLGVSLKYDASTSTLNVEITNKTATVYKLSVDTQTIDLWAGDPIRTSAELKEIFRGHIKAVEDKTPVSSGIELSDSQYSLEITSNWVNTVTPVGSPRSFTVKVTPTQAAINEYPGLATLSGEYLKVNFKEITYELQATGVAQEYWTNDPQPSAAERLKWVKDVKVKPSNTTATDTTATAVDITGIKGGSATTEVAMNKLGETVYLVTVTAKNPVNNNETIKLENVEVPITIVAPPTYQLQVNVVDADGNPINYEKVSAPFGYTLDGKDAWNTTATTVENTITFTQPLEIQSKYQIKQSAVLEPNTVETSEELPNDSSVIFPPQSGITPPGSTQELHTSSLTETYPWQNQDPSQVFAISRDESQLSYGTKTYETTGTEPIDLAEGLKAKYNKDDRILVLTVTNKQGELSLAVPDLLFQQGTPGIMKEQLLERKETAKDPWKVKIKDTLQTNQNWSLEAKLTEPFTLTGENREIKDILVYKETPTSAQQLMVLDQAMPILDKTSAGAPNTEQFYEKTWEKQAGFLLSVDKQKSMGIKGGVYTAALEFTLKDAD